MRDNAFPQNHLRFPIPAVSRVPDLADVRAVARALCTIPEVPPIPGMHSCPVDIGITYYLAFSDRHGPLSEVAIVNATGCQWVDVPGKDRPTFSTGRLWTTLAAAFHTTSAALRGFSSWPH